MPSHEEDSVAAAAAAVTDADSKKAAESDSITDSDRAPSSDFTSALLVSAEDEAGLDERFTTSRKELWSFYAYYIGNSGLGPFNFAPSQFQNILSLAASDASNGMCGDTGQPVCRLFWAGSNRTVESIVLLANGISFAIQAFIFLVLGTFADFGHWRPYILLVSTIITIAVSFAWLGVEEAYKWQIGIGLYIVGLVGYQTSLTFWTAAFPGLARNLPEVRESRAKLERSPPETTPEQHHLLDVITRNRVSNIAFTVSSCGEFIILCVIQGMLAGLHADDDIVSNTKALSAATAFSGGIWLLVALPWFVLEKHRPGRKLPPGTNVFTAGIILAWSTLKQVWHLKQTLLYLCFYFIMGDALNTSVTVISTLQNTAISFSSTKLNELLLVGIATQALGIYGFWLIQKRFTLQTKTMLVAVSIFIVLMQGWGLIGIYTQRFGFHQPWEFWLYQVLYGLFVCPWYAVSQTYISEVAPAGLEFQTFALLNLVGRTSSFIGPFVSSAITDDSGNGNTPFYFLIAMSFLGLLLTIPLNSVKGRKEQRLFIEQQAKDNGVVNKHDSTLST